MSRWRTLGPDGEGSSHRNESDCREAAQRECDEHGCWVGIQQSSGQSIWWLVDVIYPPGQPAPYVASDQQPD